MESKQASKRHLQTGEGRGWDWCKHGKQTSQQGTLTDWTGHKFRLVRIQKKGESARGTHLLEWHRLQLIRKWNESEPVRSTYKLERTEVRMG